MQVIVKIKKRVDKGYTMEAKATKRFLPGSPRKMRLVIDMIRGKRVDEAVAILKFSPKRAARDASRVLSSAFANLNNNNSLGIGTADAFVKDAFVNQGPVLKRISPAPMGRAYRIRKRTNHITIVVSTLN
jgi:large subunit ribosomal protein L22